MVQVDVDVQPGDFVTLVLLEAKPWEQGYVRWGATMSPCALQITIGYDRDKFKTHIKIYHYTSSQDRDQLG